MDKVKQRRKKNTERLIVDTNKKKTANKEEKR